MKKLRECEEMFPEGCLVYKPGQVCDMEWIVRGKKYYGFDWSIYAGGTMLWDFETNTFATLVKEK